MENENVNANNPQDETPSADATPASGNGSAPSAEAQAPDLAALQKELDETKVKAAEYLDGLQRERAAFANYKKRVDREQAETSQMAAARVINRYLDIVDDFDRALKDRPTEGDAAKWAEGIVLIYRKFQNVLDSEGVTRIEAEGKEFDPKWHEAVVHEDSDSHASGHVVEVLRHGYKIGERVIRPALVKVAK
jgi:molecular chaperone GrpE